MNFVGVALQIVIGIVIAMIVYSIANRVMVYENVVVDYTKPITTKIFEGWVNAMSFVNRSYNTYNEFATNYREMPRSVNRHGGAQFSFSVWTRFDDVSVANVKNKVLFVYGDPNRYTVTKKVGASFQETVTDYVIKCPLVAFTSDGEGIRVDFNTNENIGNAVVVNKVRSLKESTRHNVMSMVPGKWTLWTFVFADSITYDAKSESGVVVKMYVNDFLHFTQKVGGSLRTNKGSLTVLPEGINGGFLGDLTYYNWALTSEEVQTIVSGGLTNKYYNDMDSDGSFNVPNYLTEYNKLEIYNV